EAEVIKHAQGMVTKVADSSRLEIRREVDLQGNTVVAAVVEEIAIHLQPNRMTETMGTAFVECLADGFRAVRLARMNGNVDVVFEDKIEGFLMIAGVVIPLCAGEVERHDTAMLIHHAKF